MIVDPWDFAAQKNWIAVCRSLESQEVAKGFPQCDPTMRAETPSLRLEFAARR